MYRRRIKVIFSLHFAFAMASHILLPVMLGGIVKVLWGSSLGFWESGLILGAALFSMTYLTNHITNEEGFCCLTALENHYREESGMDGAGDFLPRFYSKCAEIIRWVIKRVKRS